MHTPWYGFVSLLKKKRKNTIFYRISSSVAIGKDKIELYFCRMPGLIYTTSNK